MNRRIWSARRLAPLGVLALVAGAAGAQAAGGGAPDPKAAAPRAMTPAMPAAPAPLAALPVAAAPMASSPAGTIMPLRCRPPGTKAASAPPSEALKDAFGILRRERTDDDALPDRVLEALKARGLKLVDPQATRLLRADRRARAWVVPVPDVDAASGVVCRGPRARPLPAPAPAPREGLVVVAVGGAPAGGGGALRDLQRGLAPATLDPCAGADRDMLGVSGIVPDGVESVFVTAADGSATRADVHDNGYSFVLPRPRRPEQRYVVWSGANGAPHVQPLPAFVLPPRPHACRQPAELICVTPEPWGAGCLPDLLPGVRPAPAPRGAARARPRPARAVRTRSPRPRSAGRVAPMAPMAPAPFPLPMALSVCAAGFPPMVEPGRGPALQVPRAVPPPTWLVPGPARRPRAPRATPRAPRGVPAPTAPAPARPTPPRAP